MNRSLLATFPIQYKAEGLRWSSPNGQWMIALNFRFDLYAEYQLLLLYLSGRSVCDVGLLP